MSIIKPFASAPKSIAIIPARGGSIRIPGKNVAPLGGKPLIAHTIEAALAAEEIDQVFVSTECQRIAQTAKRYGATVITRPLALSGPYAQTEPALIHAVEIIEANHGGQEVEFVTMLQPTSPLRGTARINEAVRLMRENPCDTVVSVVKDVGYYFCGDMIDNNNKIRFSYDPKKRLRTQDIKPKYRENGAIYVMTRKQLMEEQSRMGRECRALVLSDKESIDIDTLTDLNACEVFLKDQTSQVFPWENTEKPNNQRDS